MFALENKMNDLSAGFTLFLIALPLSIGISLASGAPPAAGILAAIVGGMLGSWLGGSPVAINGPAAGMIAILLTALHDFSVLPEIAGNSELAFHATLGAICAAGLIQIAFGVFRLGKIGALVPKSVIHGMMTAIGIIIIAKQFHVMLGVIPIGPTIPKLIAAIPNSVLHPNAAIAIIGVACLAIQLFLNFTKAGKKTKIPGALGAAAVGYLMASLLDFDHPHDGYLLGSVFHVEPKALLHVEPDFFGSIFQQFQPNFSFIQTFTFWKSAVFIALVGSIESILSLAAVDHLDPEKRKSNVNRELWSKGVCNSLLGLIGGIPIITEVVRSSANVHAGARTSISNLLHGFLILAFVFLFPNILNQIPLAAFASILILVGYRLAAPKSILEEWAHGWKSFLCFLLTATVTICDDLLVGVASGIILHLFLKLIFKETGGKDEQVHS
jgi:MFS superfamily sulfate permease-like transporter